MKPFKDKIALVTGGNSGIGYVTAKMLIAHGADVIITGRRQDAIEKAANEIGAILFVADQAKLAHIDQLYEQISKQFGKLDILFINAGIASSARPSESIAQMTPAYFDNMMNINFRGAYFTLSKFIPLLAEGASVVFLSSIVAHMHSANSSVYSASKAALNSIAKTAAVELAPKKIRVNIVSPGPTQTAIMHKSGLNEHALAQLFDQLTHAIPLKKIGLPEDVAQLVIHLCDDASSFITGSEFVIDGGLTL